MQKSSSKWRGSSGKLPHFLCIYCLHILGEWIETSACDSYTPPLKICALTVGRQAILMKKNFFDLSNFELNFIVCLRHDLFLKLKIILQKMLNVIHTFLLVSKIASFPYFI